jgi:hypothetical protein
MPVWSRPLPVIVLLAGCGRSSSPPAPSGPTSFLAGTWRGSVTIAINPEDPNPTPPSSGATEWTFEVTPQTNQQSFRTTVKSEHAWLRMTTTGTTALTPGNSPPTRISTQGEFDSPRGCRGTFGSVGTADASRIEADFTGTDCEHATFAGRVVLTKN